MISPVNGQKLAFQHQWFGVCHNKKKKKRKKKIIVFSWNV